MRSGRFFFAASPWREKEEGGEKKKNLELVTMSGMKGWRVASGLRQIRSHRDSGRSNRILLRELRDRLIDLFRAGGWLHVSPATINTARSRNATPRVGTILVAQSRNPIDLSTITITIVLRQIFVWRGTCSGYRVAPILCPLISRSAC